MAVTVDQASLGTQAESGVSASSLNTTADVAPGGMLAAVTFAFRSGGVNTLSMSGGSLTWTQAHTVVSGNLRICLFYAFAPSGLASGATVTVTQSAGVMDATWGAASYLGVDTTGTVTAFGGAAASTAAWATGTIAGNAGDAYIGGAGGDGTLRTSTPTSPAVERIDFNSATTSGSVTLVDTLAGNASDSLAGTWSGTLGHVAIGAAFKPSAGGGAAVQANTPAFQAIPFMGR